MTRLGAWLGCVVACCLSTPAVTEEMPSIVSGVQIQASGKPVAVATEITIDGQPVALFWDQYFTDLFAILDRNDNGSLDGAEAARIPRPACLLAEFRGDFDNVTADFEPLAAVDRSPADGKISRDELAQYLRHAGVGSGELRVAPTAQGLDLASARRLFDLLASSQGTWNSTCLADAYSRLRRFDVNDDERLSLAELRLTSNGSRSPVGSEAQQRPLFAPLTKSEATPLSFAKLMIQLGMPQQVINRVDVAHRSATVESLNCHVGAVRLTFQVARGLGAQDFDSARQSLLQQFEADDLDHNQILDQRETQQSASSNYFSMLMAVADRDANGRLTAQEMDRYLALQSSAAKHCLVMTGVDLGSSLATILDADGDATLTLHELRHGWSRVAAWDGNGNHALSWDDIPHECQLTWSIGRPQPLAPVAASPKKELTAPGWFLKMDQNEDGYLSRREFFGSLEELRRYDTDGDGIISPAEAIQAKEN